MSDYIPQEIQYNILKHLPIKPLLRARCVCKWWKQAIDSEPFIHDHLALQKPRIIVETEEPHFLIGYPSQLPPFDTLLSPRNDRRLHLVGTLHGILCLYDASHFEFLVWNPWISEAVSVANQSEYHWFDDDPQFHMGQCAGFWIDARTKEFKIIVLNLHGDIEEEEEEEDMDLNLHEMYSSNDGTWKTVPLGRLEMYYTMDVNTATVIDGVGYWPAFYNVEDEEKKMNGVVVVAFDFVKEVFLEPIVAPRMKAEWERPVLWSRDGALSLVYMERDKTCGIIEMKQGKWVFVAGFCLAPGVSRILWVGAETGKIIAATESGELILLDTGTRLLHVLKTGLKAANDFVIAHGFVESLVRTY